MNSHHTVEKIVSLGRRWRFEEAHALRVSRLALQLFDQLQPLHSMGNTERIWLRAAALLHDVAKKHDPTDHHKTARDVILAATDLPFRWEERVIIALAARYHRGALPDRRHAYFGTLESDAQRYVTRLAALLRLADGLDKGRAGFVEDVHCEVRKRNLRLTLVSSGTPAMCKALQKADLLSTAFGRSVVMDVETVPQREDFCLEPSAENTYIQNARV